MKSENNWIEQDEYKSLIFYVYLFAFIYSAFLPDCIYCCSYFIRLNLFYKNENNVIILQLPEKSLILLIPQLKMIPTVVKIQYEDWKYCFLF